MDFSASYVHVILDPTAQPLRVVKSMDLTRAKRGSESETKAAHRFPRMEDINIRSSGLSIGFAPVEMPESYPRCTRTYSGQIIKDLMTLQG